MNGSNSNPDTVAKVSGEDVFVEALKRAVRQATGVTFKQMVSRSRKIDLVYVRMIFAHRLLECGYPYRHIGKLIGRDRTTVYHAIRQYENELTFNAGLRNMDERIRSLITAYVIEDEN
jgi:chromosomal replication initiation ATPase DnaA